MKQILKVKISDKNDKSYTISISDEDIYATFKQLENIVYNRKCLIVISKKVYNLYKNYISFDNLALVIIEDGEKPEIIIEEEQPEQKPQSNPDYYIGTLRIPKISFYKGYTSIDSPYNDVDYNINVLKYSQYPNIEKGNFIVAGHSGSAWNSFFKDLIFSINNLINFKIRMINI